MLSQMPLRSTGRLRRLRVVEAAPLQGHVGRLEVRPHLPAFRLERVARALRGPAGRNIPRGRRPSCEAGSMRGDHRVYFNLLNIHDQSLPQVLVTADVRRIPRPPERTTPAPPTPRQEKRVSSFVDLLLPTAAQSVVTYLLTRGLHESPSDGLSEDAS